MVTITAVYVTDPCSISAARAILRRLHIEDAIALDRYIVHHPVLDTRGRSSLPSRLEVLTELVGYFAAQCILNEMHP